MILRIPLKNIILTIMQQQPQTATLLNQKKQTIFKPILKQSTLPSYHGLQSMQEAGNRVPHDSQHPSNKHKTASTSKYSFNNNQFEENDSFLFGRHEAYQKRNESHSELQNRHEIRLNQGSNLLIGKEQFNPILPKFTFKSILEKQFIQKPPQEKHSAASQWMSELKVKKLSYPEQVEQLIREYETEKSVSHNVTVMEQRLEHPEELSTREKLYRDASVKFKKQPYYPKMGANQRLFWAHSIEKVVLWYYPYESISDARTIAVIDFSGQVGPISALEASFTNHGFFNFDEKILLCVGFFERLQIYLFDFESWRRSDLHSQQLSKKLSDSDQYWQQISEKYLKLKCYHPQVNFYIRYIHAINLRQTSKNSQSETQIPSIILTDGGQYIELIDLQSSKRFKSYDKLSLKTLYANVTASKTKAEIIKMLYSRDPKNPRRNYVFVLKRQTQPLKSNTLCERFKALCNWNTSRKQQMKLCIYSWDSEELKSQSVWQKLRQSSRIQKVNEFSSWTLTQKIKDSFNRFYSRNEMNDFVIADISLTKNEPQFLSLYGVNISQLKKQSLKVTFSNGTFITLDISRRNSFAEDLKVIPHINNSHTLIGVTYEAYHSQLLRRKLIPSYKTPISKHNSMKNCYIYEPIGMDFETQLSPITSVISQRDGLCLSEDKYIVTGEFSTAFAFFETSKRKPICTFNNYLSEKSYLVLGQSHIDLVQQPNLAEIFILLGHLIEKDPKSKKKVVAYIDSLIKQCSELKRVCVFEKMIDLLIGIDQLGKTKFRNFHNRLIDQIMKDFLKKKGTEHIDQQESQESTEKVYVYTLEVTSKLYSNICEYFFVEEQEKVSLEDIKSTDLSIFGSKTVQIHVTEFIYKFLWEVILIHGMKRSPDRPPLNGRDSNSQKFSYFNDRNSQSANIITSMVISLRNISQSQFSSALSQYLVNVLWPVLKVPYRDFSRIQTPLIKVFEALQNLDKFLEKLIRETVYITEVSEGFQETIHFARGIRSSTPKVIVLLKLFRILGEENKRTDAPKQAEVKQQEICLESVMFDVSQKNSLARLAVKSLYEENPLVLDEFEELLPEIDIHGMRYFEGWKRLNLRDQQSQSLSTLTTSSKPLVFWRTAQEQTSRRRQNANLLDISKDSAKTMQEEQNSSPMSVSQISHQEMNWICQSLDDHNYETYHQYFSTSSFNYEIIEILLAKISTLQNTYFHLNNKYLFEKESRIAQTFAVKNEQSGAHFKDSFALSPKYRTFLYNEEKLYYHQIYLQSLRLFKFFNQKLKQVFSELLEKYSQVLQLCIRTEERGSSKSKPWEIFVPCFGKEQSKLPHEKNLENLRQHILLVKDLVLAQGSQFSKAWLYRSLYRNPSSCFLYSKEEFEPEVVREVQEDHIYSFQKLEHMIMRNKSRELKRYQIGQKRSRPEDHYKNIHQIRTELLEQKARQNHSIGSLGSSFTDGNWMQKHNFGSF